MLEYKLFEDRPYYVKKPAQDAPKAKPREEELEKELGKYSDLGKEVGKAAADKIKETYKDKTAWDVTKSVFGYAKNKTTNYFKKNVKEYQPDPTTEDKNAKKATVGLAAGAGISVASQIALLTWIPGVNIVFGGLATTYGGVKAYQWYKDRKVKKDKEKQAGTVETELIK